MAHLTTNDRMASYLELNPPTKNQENRVQKASGRAIRTQHTRAPGGPPSTEVQSGVHRLAGTTSTPATTQEKEGGDTLERKRMNPYLFAKVTAWKNSGHTQHKAPGAPTSQQHLVPKEYPIGEFTLEESHRLAERCGLGGLQYDEWGVVMTGFNMNFADHPSTAVELQCHWLEMVREGVPDGNGL